VIRHGAEDGKVRLQILAQCHDTRHVTTSVAVVWRRPDGDDVLVLEVVLVAFVDKLMCACYQLEAVDVVELWMSVWTRLRWIRESKRTYLGRDLVTK